jgi:hypothetical protein
MASYPTALQTSDPQPCAGESRGLQQWRHCCCHTGVDSFTVWQCLLTAGHQQASVTSRKIVTGCQPTAQQTG